MLENVFSWINSISLCDKSISFRKRLSKVFWLTFRILFRDRSITVSDGPLRKTPSGISIIWLCDRLINCNIIENDKRPASMSAILLPDKSSTCSCLRSLNKLLEIARMLFPERSNLVNDVRPRSVSFVTVRLFPDRSMVFNVVWLKNTPSGSCWRRLLERFNSVVLTSSNAAGSTDMRPVPDTSMVPTRSPANACDWMPDIVVSPWNDNDEKPVDDELNDGIICRCPRSSQMMLSPSQRHAASVAGQSPAVWADEM